MPRFVLIGLVEPGGPESQAAFDEWFIGQHVEDTARCPNFVRGTSPQARRDAPREQARI